MTLRISAALALSMTSAATAQAPTRDPMRMDVAGVRLGMPIAQVRTAMATSGYRCDMSTATEPTFDERVRKIVDERRGVVVAFGTRSAPAEETCTGPSGEGLRIWFAQARSGSVVDSFDLYLDAKRIDKSAVKRQLAAKYGPPPFDVYGAGTWCSGAKPCGSVKLHDVATFKIDTAYDVRIRANRGYDVNNAEEAEVIAAADRIQPKKSGAAL